jgi:hypothetical protein
MFAPHQRAARARSIIEKVRRQILESLKFGPVARPPPGIPEDQEAKKKKKGSFPALLVATAAPRSRCPSEDAHLGFGAGAGIVSDQGEAKGG